MNYELFLAKRIIADKAHKNSISSPIIKIASTAIALGLVIMLIAVATAAGLQHKIRDKISGFKGHVQITNYDNNNSEFSTKPIAKNQDFYPDFNTVPGIKNIQIFANKGGIIRTTTDFEGILLKGVSTDYDWSFFNEYLVQGRIPNITEARCTEILISTSLSKRLQLKLNDPVNVFFLKTQANALPSKRKLTIVGIYDTGFEEFDKNILIGDIREVQRLNKWTENQVGGFEVLLTDFENLTATGNAIYNAIDPTLNSMTIVESYPTVFEWIELFDNNVTFIIVLMVLIAGINMITALLVLILERVQMVGILKALGSSNWSIRKVFLYNASFLILKGLFWGNLIGLTLLGLQHYFKIIQLDPATYYVSTVPVHLTFSTVALLNLGTLVLCFTMLLVPSYIVSTIQPSKSIRFS